MIRMKVGGMILTGVAAFLVADKAVRTLNNSVIAFTEASKWKGYYKCWSKGDAKGEPVPPGYSMTTRPEGVNGEVVYDPTGKDHSQDNQEKAQNSPDPTGSVKAVCEAVKAVAEKAIDSLSKRPEAAEGAKEGQTEAFWDDICEDQVKAPGTDEKDSIENVIDGAFGGAEPEDETGEE